MSTLDNPILEDGNTKPGSIAIRYGLIGGLILVAFGLITQLTGLVDMSNPQSGTNRLVSMLTYVAIIVVLVMAVRAYKSENGGFATFGRGFTVGILTTLIIAAISIVWTFVYFGLIDPTLVETLVEASKEQMMEQQGMSEEDAERAMGVVGFMFNPIGMAIMSGVTLTFMGAIFSLVIAAILKKNPPESI